MKKIHLIMPMGGKGTRFLNHGYDFPKPLLRIHDRPFFYWSTQSIVKYIDVFDITFVVLREHVDKFAIDEEIRKFYPEAKIIVLSKVLNGAVLTCLEGTKGIEDNYPILFNDCDHIFHCSMFQKEWNNNSCMGIDGALMTFVSDESKYSFLRFDENENVVETVEKKVISNDAICGCYYFKNKRSFEDAAEVYLKECEYKEFFISGVYNIMAKQKKVVRAFRTDYHIPFGIPEEYEIAKKSNLFEELV